MQDELGQDSMGGYIPVRLAATLATLVTLAEAFSAGIGGIRGGWS